MILYHYCSNGAFHSIIEKREIWLSSLSLSNDSAEGKWLRTIFNKVCADENLGVEATQRMIGLIGGLESVSEGLGFCLSEHGDMLSQWRGYASDASGMCIGFSKKYFEKLAVSYLSDGKQGFVLQQVEYSEEIQKSIVKPAHDTVQQFIDEGAFQLPGPLGIPDTRNKDEIEATDQKVKKAYDGLMARMLSLFPELFRLKNPAFSEEKEWRLINYFLKNRDEDCEFRTTTDRIIPYRSFPIPEEENGPVTEVILGPKNITPIDLVEAFLKQRGFTNIKVTRSAATYR